MTGSHTARGERRGDGPPARGRRGRRSKVRTAAVVTGSCLVLLVAGGGWVYLRLNGNITTFGADGVSQDRPAVGVGGSNVLVIGSDSRSGGNRELGGGEGDVGRSDTAFLLHVYGDGKHAVAVSFPRDTLVDVPPCKLPDGSWTRPRTDVMFNTAFTVGLSAKGNPACTQNTVEKLTGLRVDHTVVVDFEGFSKMTSAVGGISVCLPKNVYQGDLNPHRGSRGSLVFPKGLQTVSGQKALDYVRLRHGIGDGSDIGRIKRQQAFVSSLIKKVKSAGADALWAALRADRTVDGKDAGGSAPHGGGAASPRPTAPVSGAGIHVAVYNGTTVPGLAAHAADGLRTAGFTVTGTATASTQDHATTVIAYGPGQYAQARTAARLFPGAQLRPTAAPGVEVTVGRSYADHPGAGADGTPAPSGDAPSAVPPDTADKARSADENPCSDLSYG
ncbi:LCP family protein [Streptomyces lydicus]|uniref:LCP family protein n=1 Tax=Streptomyces lydicus TaxID=47763 RepID=UPI0037BAC975